MLKQITLVGPAAPTPRAAATSAEAITLAKPLGNMAQVMRGILFPSSNLLFQVQTYDPAAPKTGYEPGTASFSWVDWGAGIYSGWELVDYAAVAIAESAPLLLAPARRCENGKPVPVDRPDWIQFTAELAEAGRAAYRASQSRNREAVSDVTNQIADACLHCHEVYRDKPGGTTVDPSNKAAPVRKIESDWLPATGAVVQTSQVLHFIINVTYFTCSRANSHGTGLAATDHIWCRGGALFLYAQLL